ncbi:MAG: pyruvate formate lyase-activating protein [Alphaproteobacteria bacterium]|nr:MAG: pyruvate formate lyase-activating protein [Alphaproteobacteria bacterium]
MQQRNTLSLLEAASPFELRVDQGKNVSEAEVRAALKSGDVGFLHSFTTGSAVDGPGIRLVAWTASCNFRCQYCHNPDTWTLANGTPVTIGRALAQFRKYTAGLKAMKGGFTLSGGEPLMQPRFAAKLFAIAKAIQIHTAIETNGYYGDRLSDEELQDIDLVILDMKAISPDRHRNVTGGREVGPVIEFCLRLAELRRPMWFRYVLVPGLTDDPQEMTRIANFAADLGVVERVEVLPFHQMGKYKWEMLALDYKLADTPTPSVQELTNAIWIFRNAGLNAS